MAQLSRPDKEPSSCAIVASPSAPVPTIEDTNIVLGDVVNFNYAAFEEGNFASSQVNYSFVVIRLGTKCGKEVAVLADLVNPDNMLDDVYTRYLWKHKFWQVVMEKMGWWMEETRGQNIESSIRRFPIGTLVKVGDKFFIVEEWCNSTVYDCYSTYGIRAQVCRRQQIACPFGTTGPRIIARQQVMKFCQVGNSKVSSSPMAVIDLMVPYNRWLHQQLDDELISTSSSPVSSMAVFELKSNPPALRESRPLHASTMSSKRKSSDE